MTTLDIIREEMECGRKAYKAGLSIHDCPHSPMVDNLRVIAWENGWKEQRNNSERA